MTRGERNNNPLNIRRNGQQWQGQRRSQTDAEFVQFNSNVWGYRAAAIILWTYATRYGLNTIRGIISRWAPQEENDTNAYIKNVASWMNVDPDDEIDMNSRDKVRQMLTAMHRQENGTLPDRQSLALGIMYAFA